MGPDRTVTVAIPTFGAGDLVVRAVRSVLASTHSNLRVVVVNDADSHSPWPFLASVRDDRLVRVDLPVNRGASWCRAVVLAACTTRWFATVDADDTINPTMYERLVAAADGERADVAVCGYTVVDGDRVRDHVPARHRIGGLAHITSHCAGVWQTDLARRVGGPHPLVRIGDDKRWVSAMCRAADTVAIVDEALYEYRLRPGSLWTDPATGPRSLARRRAWQHRQALWARMVRTPVDQWATLIPRPDGFADDVARVREALT